MSRTTTDTEYAVCVRNDECEDLEIRRIYQILPDKRAARDGYLRVVDESGEDYLYPETYFAPVKLPQQARRAVAAIA